MQITFVSPSSSLRQPASFSNKEVNNSPTVRCLMLSVCACVDVLGCGCMCIGTCVCMSTGNTNSMFALDYISGSLTVQGQLDRENPLYSAGFTLTVKVRPHWTWRCVWACLAIYVRTRSRLGFWIKVKLG